MVEKQSHLWTHTHTFEQINGGSKRKEQEGTAGARYEGHSGHSFCTAIILEMSK